VARTNTAQHRAALGAAFLACSDRRAPPWPDVRRLDQQSLLLLRF